MGTYDGAAGGTGGDSRGNAHVTVQVFFPLRNSITASAGERVVRPALCSCSCLPNFLSLWSFKPVIHISSLIIRQLPCHQAVGMDGDAVFGVLQEG